MIIPLEKRLKKRAHVEVASLQDEAVEILYRIDNSIVLHGGTAVWRCYGGNRFSEDLDFYCGSTERIEKHLRARLEERGLETQKFKKTANLIFCKVSDGSAQIRIEINHAGRKSAAVRRYEKVDGTFMDVLTLTPEELIIEKLRAYANRRFIRDIYDIYHLLDHLSNGDKARKTIAEFIASVKAPVDEGNLKTIVYAGAVPSFGQIVDSIRRRVL